jgi:3-dehydroquinate dehydratase/shikimate dehydrogenase
MLAAMRSLPPQVELVEVRLDMMARPDVERVCAGKDRPIIVTNRPAREGGAYDGPEGPRLDALRRAAALGADYVDVELDAVAALGELPGGTRRIVSVHDPSGTPPDLEAVFQRIRRTGPDVAKVVVTAKDAADAAAVLGLLDRHAQEAPLIALSMGEEGVASRILAGKFGAFLTFASQAAGAESAPGQVPVEQMLGMYRFPRIGRKTAVYGVVANPVAHSMSPAVHNAAFGALGMDAVYVPFKVTDLRAFLEAFQPCDLRGLSVTIPHKEAMLRLVDEADDLAASIGAVNTVDIRHGRRLGSNTDVGAAVMAIEDAVRRAGLGPLSSRTVLLVGAGGAARAIAHGLRGRTARLIIANRTFERGRTLAAEVGAEACGLDEIERLRPDVLVNGTAVGMWPRVQDSPVPAPMLRKGMVVFDSVYNPIRTRLLAEAEAAGAVTASGVEWFVNQASAQFELWTGARAPRDVMEDALRSRLAPG